MSTVYRAPKLLIQGQWRAGRHAMTMPIVNPVNSQKLDDLQLANSEDIALALEAAQTGFEAWRQLPAHERCARLEKASPVCDKASSKLPRC